VHPDWPVKPYVYLAYTRTGNMMRLVRYQVWGETGAGGDTLQFVLPLLLLDDILDDNSNHNAGCLRFGPDGYLYMSLGEDADFCAAADSTSLKGQILRLDVGGLPISGGPVPREDLAAPGNPYYLSSDSNARLVWAYGLRNPWRFHFDSVFGTIYVADPGEEDYEELNEVVAGDFLGWPWREGPMVLDRTASCPEPGGTGANNYKPPIATFPHAAGLTSIVSAGMYRPMVGGTANWPLVYAEGAYGNVFYGEYFSGWLRRMKKQGGVWSPAPPVPGQPNATDWATGLPRPVDFMVDATGSLVYLSQFDASGVGATGSVRRIVYAPPVSTPRPTGFTAGLSASPNPFFAATTLSFAVKVSEPVTLDIFDVGGRRVRRLYEGRPAAGTLRLDWDGRNETGGPVAPGAYLVRFSRPGAAETIRLVRLR
jgi:hypothetical protein